ncbi:MAG: MFS transporter [Dehalococcoidia bacterium]
MSQRPPVDLNGAPPPEDEAPPGWRQRTFAALEDPFFRLLFIGNTLQFGSMQMQLVVRGWLVYDLTGSFAALGTMALANAVPSLLLSPVGGVVADRAPKKTVIQLAQAYNAVNAAILAVLAAGWFGLDLEFWHLFLSSALQGTVNSLMQPSRQSIISDLVPRDRLMNAVGINASGQTLMQLIGPGAAGVMIALVSPATVFWTMAAMYALAVSFTIRIPAHPLYAFTPPAGGQPAGGRRGPRGLRELVDGLRYVWDDRTIRMVMSVNFFIVLVAMPYTQLLPGFVESVLHRGPFELGVLQSVQGIGAVAGALVLASAASRRRGQKYLWCGVLLGGSIVAFAVSQNFWITLPIMVLIGAGQAGRMALGQVLVQTYAHEQYRGRVMAVWFMEFGLVQLGTFVVGVLAEFIGPQLAIGGLAATLVLAMGLIAATVPRMRALD